MRLLLVPLLALPSCVTLDWVVFNPVHCTTVGPETCEAFGNAWDDICVPCDEAYDWQRDYPWFDETLAEGESIRPIEVAVERFPIPTADGEGSLDTYWIPSHGEVPELAETTILYNHGNYAGLEHYLPRIRMLHEAGYNVLAWDFRGYGKSEPETTPTPDQFLADARTVRDAAPEVVPDPDRIIVYANSLGGIPAVEMAVHDEPCALFLEAPWTSMASVAKTNSRASMPETFFSEGQYDNFAKIGEVEAPVFGMCGDEDNKFPIDEVRRLVEGSAGVHELWVLPGVKHGISNIGVPEAGYGEYAARMREFLDAHAPECLTP